MTFSKRSRSLGVLAVLAVAAFFVCSSVGSNKLQKSTSAPLAQPGAVLMLLADGGAPAPPAPPPPNRN